MAVIVNLNTRQSPITVGATGTQVVKFIDCPRIYIKAVDSTPTPVTVKSNGVLPTGWTDLGIVNGKAKITYEKEMKEVRTGIDQVLRAVYVDKKTGKFEFGLSQFDDAVYEALSGLTPTLTGTAPAATAAQFAVGSEDVIQKALLVVLQNKLDGKEWQFYHPNAYMSYTINDNGDETFIQGSADLPMFSIGSGNEAIMYKTIYA